MHGKIYLIPSSLGNDQFTPIPEEYLPMIEQLPVFITERGKTARKYLRQVCPNIHLQSKTFLELNNKTPYKEIADLLAPALNEGKDIGVLSEAGCPGVADPGAKLVSLAHQKSLEVIPLIGPSSILLALMGSGLNGQKFTFNGYLPIDSNARKREMQKLEGISKKLRQTQIFIETPYRNNNLLKDMLQALSPNTLLCVATDLTLPSQFIATKKIGAWGASKLPDLHKRPTIFLFLG